MRGGCECQMNCVTGCAGECVVQCCVTDTSLLLNATSPLFCQEVWPPMT